ncbi:MAG: bifunctional nuclease family protein [bacterium]|nr:bifunctional nuclease family protein [bacterium]
MSPHTPPQDSIAMEIKGLILDPSTSSPVVVLHTSTDGEWFLPIWIGPAEANSIALHLEGVEPPRPMTHDLFVTALSACGMTVPFVFINSLSDSVFFAEIPLVDRDGNVQTIDARPSDAIAIAIRVEAPLHVAKEVLDQARVPGASGEDALRLILERLRPEDLGEYQM